MDCDHFSCLLTWPLEHCSTEFKTLQMLFWSGPTYFGWVEARRRIDTCSILLDKLQTMRTLKGRQILSQFDQLDVAHLVDGATWFFTDGRSYCLFDKSLRMDFFAQFSTFPTFCWFISSSLHVQDSILRYSFNLKINLALWLFETSWLKISYKSLCTSLIIRCIASEVSCLRLALPYKSPCTSHVITNRLLLLHWESFEQISISVLRSNSVDAICWHKTVYDDDCMWFRLPELQSLILRCGLCSQYTASWSRFLWLW